MRPLPLALPQATYPRWHISVGPGITDLSCHLGLREATIADALSSLYSQSLENERPKPELRVWRSHILPPLAELRRWSSANALGFGQLPVWRSRLEKRFARSSFVEFALGSLDFSPPPVEVAIGEPESRAPHAEVGVRRVIDLNSTCRNHKKNGMLMPIIPSASIPRKVEAA